MARSSFTVHPSAFTARIYPTAVRVSPPVEGLALSLLFDLIAAWTATVIFFFLTGIMLHHFVETHINEIHL